MSKIIMAVVLCFTFMAGNAGLSVKASSLEDRATWLWNPQMIVSDPTGTLTFLESKHVNKVYVQIDSSISMQVYRSFIEHASANGMRIYALSGDPKWVAPNGWISQNQLMSWLSNYQKGSAPLQKFTGVHLDVEPYLYSGWTTNQADTIKSYQSLLTKAKNSAASLKLSFEADIPFWFDGVFYKNTYGKGTLAEWVIANTNSVTVMAYRDSAAMIIDLVKNEITLAGKYKKPLDIGVETAKSAEGDDISFYEEGETYMNQQLDLVNAYYAGVPGFNGFAVHHVGSWMTMTP